MWDRNHTNVWFVGTGESHFGVVYAHRYKSLPYASAVAFAA